MAQGLEHFAHQREWLLFREGPALQALPGKGQELLPVVVDLVCEGNCKNLLAHHFHGPELWFLFVHKNTMLGYGWQLGGGSPIRGLENHSGADPIRYAVAAESYLSTSIFSKKLEEVIVLAFLRETEGGAVVCTHQLVSPSGEPMGKAEQTELARFCVTCDKMADHCKCDNSPQAALAHFKNPLAGAGPLGKDMSLVGVWELLAGKKSLRIWSFHSELDHVIQECRNYVQTHSLASTANQQASHALKSEKVCPICNSEFVKSYELKRHYESVHCGLKRHQCSYCKRTFSQTGHLNEHIRVFHLMTSSCRCEVCGKHFGARSKLQRHIMAVHENRRSYSCQICGKSFKEKSHVNKHLNSHQ